MDRDDLRAGIGPEFVRLYHGRQWHVARPVLDFAGAEEALIGAAWCGESWPERGSKQPERLTAAVPRGAMVCTRCVSEVNSYRLVVLGVALADRRRAMADLWPTLLDGYDDDVVDAEIHCGDCGHVEHVGLCPGRVEGDPLDEPCMCFVAEG
jgi:hypothetical protein